MKRFGYLDTGPSDSEALYTETAVISALQQLQQFAGIRPTGIVDQETIKVRSLIVFIFTLKCKINVHF